MLIVRNEQLAIFRDASRERFEKRMLVYLRHSHLARYAALGEDASLSMVRRGIDLSARYGMQSIGSVSVVIDLMARFGEHFESSGVAAMINEMMARTDLPESLRIESIIKQLTAKTGGRVVVSAQTGDSAP